MENKLQMLKFRVYSQEHSKAIQEKLLELHERIKWNSEGRKVYYTNKPYLYLDEHCSLYLGDKNSDFDNHEYILCTLDDLYKMQSEPNQQSELMTKLESLQKELDKVKEEISNLNK